MLLRSVCQVVSIVICEAMSSVFYTLISSTPCIVCAYKLIEISIMVDQTQKDTEAREADMKAEEAKKRASEAHLNASDTHKEKADKNLEEAE